MTLSTPLALAVGPSYGSWLLLKKVVDVWPLSSDFRERVVDAVEQAVAETLARLEDQGVVVV